MGIVIKNKSQVHKAAINKGWGTITTIDPMYQIKRMTNQFGPIGKGWSYHVKLPLHR